MLMSAIRTWVNDSVATFFSWGLIALLVLGGVGILTLIYDHHAKGKTTGNDRFQMATSTDAFMRLDTTTGETWYFDKSTFNWAAVPESTVLNDKNLLDDATAFLKDYQRTARFQRDVLRWSDDDLHAYKWAEQNGQDDRAHKIFERLGLKSNGSP
jgi:hypothetical protein